MENTDDKDDKSRNRQLFLHSGNCCCHFSSHLKHGKLKLLAGLLINRYGLNSIRYCPAVRLRRDETILHHILKKICPLNFAISIATLTIFIALYLHISFQTQGLIFIS